MSVNTSPMQSWPSAWAVTTEVSRALAKRLRLRRQRGNDGKALLT